MITLSINKINPQNEVKSIENIIKLYDNYRDCNDFSDLECPLCKHKSLIFHKTYERNLTYYINGELENIKINIIVCECKHCKETNAKQKYHALLPEFILPYHIYEASTIINAINDYFNNVKINEIIEKIQITHKLFYDWLRGLKKYTFSSSVILKIKDDIKEVVTGIIDNKFTFLNNFYHNYQHPFFLFKITCVPLCVIP